MTDWLFSGIALGLAILLTSAGALKLRDLASFEAVLVQLLPPRIWRLTNSRTFARVVVCLEFVSALTLVAPGRGLFLVGATSATVLCICFLATILRAVRKRIPCGCFGPEGRAAGRPEILRGVFLMGISSGLTLVAFISGNVVTVVDFGAAAVAFVVVSIAVLPRVVAVGSDEFNSADPGEPIGSGESTVARRAFLARSLGAGLALAAAAAFGARNAAHADPPPPPRRCEAQFDLCYGCTTKITEEHDVACCSACYAQCQLGPPCIPGVSCGGCWPGP
jgi:hypothetical protein